MFRLTLLSACWMAFFCLCCVRIGAQPTIVVEDDFSSYQAGSDGSPRWEPDSIFWEVREGAYHADGAADSFARLAEGPMYRSIAVEATVRVEKAIVSSWKIASVCIMRDGRNFWHFALVEAPDEQGKFHFVELVESRDGAWLAQQNLRSTADENPRFDWQDGVPYRLRIAMTPEGIEGVLSDMGGRVITRQGYAFSDLAVTTGYAALRGSGLKASFDDLKMAASDPLPPPEAQAPTYPGYDVAASDLFSSDATGFFHTQQRDGVWWAIDPVGRPFYATGTDHCNFNVHWCEKLGYAPYHEKMVAKFGNADAWAASATSRLTDWGFNLLGANGSEEAFYRGLAHTRFVAFTGGFVSHSDICPRTTWTGFPNVFHPKWPAHCDRVAREQCGPHKDDPWLFGYFLDNELEWYGKTHTEWGLFDDAMKKAPDHTAKRALVKFLRERYGTVGRLNDAWGTKLRSFDSILRRHALDGSNTDQVWEAKKGFVRLCAEGYFQTCAAAIRKYDPNHMILGCRFAWDAPAGIWDIAGRYCDIVSVNIYGSVDLEKWEAPGTAERLTGYYELARKPLMLTEWSFPALDSGLPCVHGAGQRFDTQGQRAQAFEIYQTMLFRLPFMVGSDYFMWVDEPALGISSTFPEDTNYGLVNEQDEPYPELTATGKRVNALAYKLHNQEYPEISVSDLRWKDGKATVTVRNTGQAGADVPLRFVIDGRVRDDAARLEARRTRAITLAADLRPGGHLLVAEADPEHRLAEADRADNLATTTVFVPGGPAATGLAMVVVSNPTPQALGPTLVAIPLGRLPPAAREQRRLVAEPPGAGAGFVQMDSPLQEACFLAAPLPPWGCATYTLRPAADEPTPQGVAVERTGVGFTIDSGVLKLANAGNSGDFLDAITLDGAMMGRYNPLIWQEVGGQNHWVKTDEFVGAEFHNGPARLVADLTARGGPGNVITRVDEEGGQEAQVGWPRAFEVRHRIVVYPLQSWFGAKFVSIKNLSDRPLTLRGYFFYLNSSLGADAVGDAPAGPKVPNYYAPMGAAWEDEGLGLWLGAIPQDGSDIRADFWLDEGGGQHPDARRELNPPIVLAPGATYAEDDAPWLYVYAGKGEAPWKGVKQTIRGMGAVQVEVR